MCYDKDTIFGVIEMLKEEFNQQNVTKLNTPKTFVKRDGSKYPFAIFKLNMVLHNLDLDNVAPAVIEKKLWLN